ncbi:ABC transporter permease subunit [Allorhizobium borbori]|uniref:Branched-chain amino acid transport system permease protein n=1 Tax=Allorhizobium borbori TaxID=485907 RepID=A0A7W6K267_9HYPH|nr:branched-chain amino acid ABC transporter permease [Allorhizobium borbori]MBB4102707.1 branched-chain amino acid transport system permease protein [Allorhizobium borbori]
MIYWLQLLLNALPLAALYAALAFGYALIFGMVRRVDITFGALFAFSGQVFALGFDAGWNAWYLVLPAALAMAAVLALAYTIGSGVLIARHVLRPLAAISPNAVIVASLGVLLVLMETARLASGTRDLWLPPLMKERMVVLADAQGASAGLTVLQVVSTALMISLVAVGMLVLRHSRFGRIWRAVCEDPQAARFCGVDAGAVFIWTAIAASAVAAVCGMLATAYYGSMSFGSGLVFGVKVALIAAVGGQDRPFAAALGAAGIAVAETFWSGYGPILWRDFAVTGGLVLLLVLSRKERSLP